jgi:hypothetical protein
VRSATIYALHIILPELSNQEETGAACSAHGRDNAHKMSVGNSEGTRPPERPRPGWEDNIKMDEENRAGVCELDLCGSRYISVAPCCGK